VLRSIVYANGNGCLKSVIVLGASRNSDAQAIARENIAGADNRVQLGTHFLFFSLSFFFGTESKRALRLVHRGES